MQKSKLSESHLISNYNLYWILSFLTICFIVLLSIQSLYIPFWQDDYFFLVKSQKVRIENTSWLTPFFPTERNQFWRPLGINSYWRFIETFLAGNVQIAHLMNVFLHCLSSIVVGWFSFTLIKLLVPTKDHLFAGILATFLYSIHASHILPVIWVSAANSSLNIIFSTLMLTFWLKALIANSIIQETLFLISTIISFILALLCKEISVVLPVLILLLSLYISKEYKYSIRIKIFFIVYIFIALTWIIIRENITNPPHEAYELKFGINVLRNTVSLILYFFNTPREALRFLILDTSLGIVIWAFLSFVLQFISFSLFFYSSWGELKTKGTMMIIFFFIVGCAPYFFFNWNSYAYYIEIGLLAYAIVIALSIHKTKIVLIASLLAITSSIISWTGNYFLEYPAIISRAFWAEEQLINIEKSCESKPLLCSGKLFLSVENEHKFLSFDIYGLIYRIGFMEENMTFLKNELSTTHPILVIPSQGNVYFKLSSSGQFLIK